MIVFQIERSENFRFARINNGYFLAMELVVFILALPANFGRLQINLVTLRNNRL
jgi:hypothetical protein